MGTKMRRALSLLALLFIAGHTPVYGAEQAKSAQFVTVPVLYLTDRAASRKGFDGQRKSEDCNSIYNLNFGALEFSLKSSLNRPLTADETRLGWHSTDKLISPKLQAKLMPGSGGEEAYHQFGQTVIDTVRKSGTNEAFVIVHGYNTTFAQAAESAAQLAYSLHRPVIVYDWPSKGKFGQYNVDAGNNEWSQEHFDRLIEELKAVKDQSGIKFNLLAHSMGNRLAIRSSPVLAGQHLFDQMYLVDPDFDAETFVHYLTRYARSHHKDRGAKPQSSPSSVANEILLAEPTTKVRILFSCRDRALPLSQFLFGGYTRLGQAADNMLATLFTPPDLGEMRERAADWLEAVKGRSEESSAENSAVAATSRPGSKAAGRPDWLVKFEWIDFTALDYGIIGHSIPYQLIANLWAHEQPGEGLALVDAEKIKPNGLSRFFGRAFHEDRHIASRLGTYKRVVAVKADSTTQLSQKSQQLQ